MANFSNTFTACFVEDINNLNETKPYTHIATNLLDYLITDNNLTAAAAKVWQFLYSKAYFNPNLEIRISYKELATAFHKSVRSICRYVNALKEYGYIVIKHNYASDKTQEENTIQIRFPKPYIEEFKSKPNRRKNNDSDEITIKIDPEQNQEIQQDSSFEISTKLDINKKISKSNNSKDSLMSRIEYLKNEQKILDKKWNELCSKNNRALHSEKEILRQNLNNIEVEIINLNQRLLLLDKNVMGEGVNNGLLNNTNNLLKLNNSPVDCYLINEKNKIYKVRKLPQPKARFISRTLNKLGFEGSANTELTKQVLFSIEKEALRHKPLNHAINIALKLIRTKRWTIPCGMRA